MKNILIISRTASTYHSHIFRKISKKNKLIALYFENDQYVDKYNSEYRSILKKDLSIFKGYKFKFIKNNILFLKYVEFCISFISLVKHHKIQNVFIFGYDHLTCWLSLILGKLLGLKILWRGEAIKKKLNFFRGIMKKIILNFFFELCDEIFFSCKKNKEFINLYTSKKLKAYPCCVDNEAFRKKYNLNQNKKKKYNQRV